jgi:hypothetical protein
MAYSLGVVINPKLNEPVLVTIYYGDVSIYRLKPGHKLIGAGYYDKGDDHYVRPAQATDLPRSHTARGVEPKKMGFGTCLYTGLCVGAYLASEGHAKIDAYGDGPGISSESESRSREADAWWDRAKKLGLTERSDEELVEEGVEIDTEDITCEHFEDEKTVRIFSAMGDITSEFEVDTYLYEKAEDSDLVLATTLSVDTKLPPDQGGVEYLWRRIVEDEFLAGEIHKDRILASDVRGLSEDGISLLSALLMAGGASDDEVDAIQLRHELGLDPSQPIKQMRLPFKPNASEKGELAQLNRETAMLRSEQMWSKLKSLP